MHILTIHYFSQVGFGGLELTQTGHGTPAVLPLHNETSGLLQICLFAC